MINIVTPCLQIHKSCFHQQNMLVYHTCKLVYDTLTEIKEFLKFSRQGPNQNAFMNVLQGLFFIFLQILSIQFDLAKEHWPEFQPEDVQS